MSDWREAHDIAIRKLHKANKRITELVKSKQYFVDLTHRQAAVITELEARVELEIGNRRTADHDPDCNYWTWDWNYSWDKTDCSCKAGAG